MTDLDAPLSASKLKTYDECPEAFRLKYIERLPGASTESRYIRRGNAVHEAIEDVLSEGSVDLADEDAVVFAFKRAYWDNGGASGYDLSQEDDEFTIDCLEVAARFTADHDPDVLAVEPEVPFSTEAVDHEEGFSGFIDVATSDAVWDWKTGSSDGKDLSETLQGAVYMAGYAAHLGRVPDRIQFVYLKEEKVKTRESSDEMYQTMVEKASSLLAAIDAEQFPANPGDPCYWCDHEVFCSESPVGGGGISWEDYP